MSDKKKVSPLVRIGDFVVDFRYVFLVIFAVLTVIGAININNVKINDSIVSYLPNKTETKHGLDVMGEEFGSFSDAKIMLEDVSVEEAYEVQAKLMAVPNVQAANFDGTEQCYKDNKALITILTKELDEDEASTFMSDVKDVLKDYKYDAYFSVGESAIEGVNTALLLACIIIIVILFVTSKTYFEPVIAGMVFVISIILNMGSNFLLGEISFITKSIAVILQLALSIDYVIIFMNQYMIEINDSGNNGDKILAIKKTVSKSILEICASSLTTVSGLMALIFMQLKIGEDIGIVLSKGIICSLLSVIFLMPSFLYFFSGIILKLQRKEKPHKAINKLSEFIFAIRRILLPIFVVVVIIAACFIPKYNFVYNPTSARAFNPSENMKAFSKIEDEFGKTNTLVILVENKDKDYRLEAELADELLKNDKIASVTCAGSFQIQDGVYLDTEVTYQEATSALGVDPELGIELFTNYAALKGESDKAADLENYRVRIIDLLTFLDTIKAMLPEEYQSLVESYYEKYEMLESKNYSRILLGLNSPIEDTSTYELTDEIRKIAEAKYNEVVLVGSSINARDLEASFTSDNVIITGVTILFIAIILMVTFKSFAATALLILTIEGSIMINFALLTLMGYDIFFMGYVVVTAIQMGATIDYAIVIASRYIQLRKKYKLKKRAIIKTLSDRLSAVITSGLILLASGFIIGFVTTSSIIAQIGLFLGMGTLISLLSTILVLPAILYICDPIIEKTTIKTKSFKEYAK